MKKYLKPVIIDEEIEIADVVLNSTNEEPDVTDDGLQEE